MNGVNIAYLAGERISHSVAKPTWTAVTARARRRRLRGCESLRPTGSE